MWLKFVKSILLAHLKHEIFSFKAAVKFSMVDWTHYRYVKLYKKNQRNTWKAFLLKAVP